MSVSAPKRRPEEEGPASVPAATPPVAAGPAVAAVQGSAGNAALREKWTKSGPPGTAPPAS